VLDKKDKLAKKKINVTIGKRKTRKFKKRRMEAIRVKKTFKSKVYFEIKNTQNVKVKAFRYKNWLIMHQ